MDETVTYNIQMLDFTVVVMVAVLVAGIILKHLWVNDKRRR